MKALPLLLAALALVRLPAWAEVGRGLEDCLAAARLSHPALRAAERNAQGQQALWVRARGGYFPQVGFQASSNRTQATFSSPNGSSRVDSWTPLSLTGQQRLYDFGSTPGQVGQAWRDYRAAESELRLQRDLIYLEVKQAYFETLRAERSLAVVELALKAREEFLATTKRLYERGRRARFDVTRAETDAFSSRLDRISVQARLDNARNRLLTALGTPDAPWLALKDTLETEGFEFKDSAAIISRAIATNPELEARRQKAAAAGESLRTARAGHLPSIDLVGSYNLNRQDSAGTSNDIRTWRAGVTATLGLFSGFSTEASVRAAAAQREASLERSEATRQTVSLEVQTALIALGESRARMQTSLVLLKSAEESMGLALQRFESGAGGTLEVTDTRLQLTGAQLNRINSLADYRIAEANLEKAVGAPLSDLAR